MPTTHQVEDWFKIDWTKVAPGDTLRVTRNHKQEGKIKALPIKQNKITIEGPVQFENYYLLFENIKKLTFKKVGFDRCGQFRANGAYEILAEDCAFTNLVKDVEIMVQLGPGNDHWTFRRCHFENCGCGIYSRFGDAGPSANYLTVENCSFKNIGTEEHPHADGHAIGVQEGHGHRILNNYTENTGEAISFWSRLDRFMTDILIKSNTVRNVRQCKNTLGHGICISGSHNFNKNQPRPGQRVNIRIESNHVLDTDGNGIRTNVRSEDKLIITADNKVENPGREGVYTAPIYQYDPFKVSR